MARKLSVATKLRRKLDAIVTTTANLTKERDELARENEALSRSLVETGKSLWSVRHEAELLRTEIAAAKSADTELEAQRKRATEQSEVIRELDSKVELLKGDLRDARSSADHNAALLRKHQDAERGRQEAQKYRDLRIGRTVRRMVEAVLGVGPEDR